LPNFVQIVIFKSIIWFFAYYYFFTKNKLKYISIKKKKETI